MLGSRSAVGLAALEVVGLPLVHRLGVVTRVWVDKHRAQIRGGLMRYAVASGLLLVSFIVVLALQGPVSKMLRAQLG